MELVASSLSDSRLYLELGSVYDITHVTKGYRRLYDESTGLDYDYARDLVRLAGGEPARVLVLGVGTTNLSVLGGTETYRYIKVVVLDGGDHDGLVLYVYVEADLTDARVISFTKVV